MKCNKFYAVLLGMLVVLLTQINPVLTLASPHQVQKEADASAVAENLMAIAILVVPVSVAVVTALITHSIDWSLKDYKGKNVLKLLLPAKGKTTLQSIANAFATPEFMLLLALGILLMLLTVLQSQKQRLGDLNGLIVFILSVPMGFFTPMVIALLLWHAMKRKLGLGVVLSALLWGAFAGTLTLAINTVFMLADGEYSRTVEIMIKSPVVEELLKGAGLFLLLWHKSVKSPFHGLLIAFCTGFGFAGFENAIYYLAKISPFDYGVDYWTSLVLYRSFFNMLAHGIFISMLGIFVTYAKTQGSNVAVAITVGYFFSMLLHSLFNFSAMADAIFIGITGMPFFFFNPLLVIAMLFGIGMMLMLMKGDLIDIANYSGKKA